MVLILIMGILTLTWASVSAELPAMQEVMEENSVSLVGAPMYWYTRTLNQSGVSTEMYWNPYNPNTVRPWDPKRRAVGVTIGNEVGDMLYQEIVHGPNHDNRTPTLAAWYGTTPIYGLEFFGHFEQNDHYGERFRTQRANLIGNRGAESADSRFAWFGENYPGYSSLRSGIIWEDYGLHSLAQVGRDYYWLLGFGGDWYGLRSERAQGELEYGPLRLHGSRDSLRWYRASQNGLNDSIQGSRTEYRLGLQWVQCRFQVGLEFQKGHSHDDYPWHWKESTLLFPWVGIREQWSKNWSWRAWIGGQTDRFLMEDTLQWKYRITGPSDAPEYEVDLSLRTRAGTHSNPFAADVEWTGRDSIPLRSNGVGWLQDALMRGRVVGEDWQIQGQLIPWIQGGTSVFMASSYSDSIVREDLGSLPKSFRRSGQVQRVQDPMIGLRESFSAQKSFFNRYHFNLGISHENRFDKQIVEWEAPKWMFWTKGSWSVLNGMTILQSMQWVSASYWNQWGAQSLRVDPHWTWNAALKQEFPKQKLSLEATWIHVLAKGDIHLPMGNADRTRFVCHLNKSF